ncbi:hypothetical protein CAPTEDRAFT_209723 [Capitella teleta]|uniref:Golgin subfamily A conserved domain-containing protein n=1 Tax=Capitella teleta TaxID=283909 RepID=R7TRK7_CAPTE|nr:hypothetical protein CAPTEDRAFT_209723 [Capitella teleta]|eukprot:ELT96212.1 hypothetical protein CAPTEDRAFT_209723 [Capitella teleta]
MVNIILTMTDLERTVTSASGSSQKHEQSSKEYSKEVDRLKMDLYKLTKSNEEFQQKNSELQGKLQKKVSDHAKSEDELIELRGKLEMTELYVQQVSTFDVFKRMESKVADISNALKVKSDVIYGNNNRLNYLNGDHAHYFGLKSNGLPPENPSFAVPPNMHAPGYMYGYRPPTGLEGLSIEQQRQYYQFYRQFGPVDYVVNMDSHQAANRMLLQNGSEKADTVNSAQIEQLLQEKGELTTRIEQYEGSFKKLSAERDQISQQYQEYIDQLQKQSQSMQVQITSLAGEKDQLQQQYADLQNVTQQMKSKHDSAEVQVSSTQAEKEQLQEQLAQLQSQMQVLQKTHETQVTDNSQLSRLIIEKEERIMALEMNVQRLGDTQVDREKLLETMQNDKTALSRALAQNKQLKTQLAELQNGFVKMSNDNMALLSQLQGEQHVSGEQGSRLSQQEAELREIREQLLAKEQRMLELEKQQEKEDEANPGVSAEEIDRKLEEFREQTPLLETLQRELSSAQDTINALTNQNSELRAQIVHSASSDNLPRDVEMNKAQVENMAASVRQLEMERNEVIDQLKEEQKERKHAQDTLLKLEQDLVSQTPATLNGDVINKPQFEALQHAMQLLESKFSGAMRSKADLTDKVERLEHIIMQLQGETDTIGEYVALYQQQRSIMRLRTLEKDDYISRLAREREEMSEKLGQLQALVMQLLGERQMLHNYHNNNQTTSPQKELPPFGSKLDSSNLEDWPDYNTSGDDSDASEVERIVGSEEIRNDSKSSTPLKTPPNKEVAAAEVTSPWSAAEEDHTAQRIMSLLTEMGNSNLVLNLDDTHFLHCIHCTGRILHV